MLHRLTSSALLASLTAVVLAQDPAQRTGSKEEYSACLDSGEVIERQQGALSRRQEELAEFNKKILAADADLSAQVKKHAPRTNAEILSYNQAIGRRNQAVKEFNERGRVLQREQTELNALIFKTNASCSSLLITLEVKEEVESERRSRAARR